MEMDNKLKSLMETLNEKTKEVNSLKQTVRRFLFNYSAQYIIVRLLFFVLRSNRNSSITRGRLLSRSMSQISENWKKQKNFTNTGKKWLRKFKLGGEELWSGSDWVLIKICWGLEKKALKNR